MNSGLFKLNLKDLALAILLFFIGTVVDSISTVIFNGALPTWIQFKAVLLVGVTGSISYLIKNFISGPQTPKYSNLFSLNWIDIGKAVLLMFVTAVVTSVMGTFSAGHFPTWIELGKAAYDGFIISVAYVIKNFFTTSEGKLATTAS